MLQYLGDDCQKASKSTRRAEKLGTVEFWLTLRAYDIASSRVVQIVNMVLLCGGLFLLARSHVQSPRLTGLYRLVRKHDATKLVVAAILGAVVLGIHRAGMSFDPDDLTSPAE